MIKNYFKTAWRNLMKNKTFSLINIAGLSIGVSASLVIFLIVQYDYSFDKFEKDNDRIYRVVVKNTRKVSGENNGNSATPDPLGNVISKEVSGLDDVVSMTRSSITKVSVSGKNSGKKPSFKTEEGILFTNTNYFNFVGYSWLAGSPTTALQQPYQVVLTESNAKLYFPELTTAQVIGKELYFDDSVRTIVTGVVKNLTENSFFKYKTFISRITLETTSLKPRFWERWNHAGPSLVFVKLSPSTTTANINRQVNQLFAKYYKPNNDDAEIRTFDLQPLSAVHFKGYYDSSSSGLADKNILYGLMAIAAFLLILACINFINLTTAQASQRAKEIGVRKTMGSSKGQLMAQFMSETFLLTCIATIVSISITPLLLKAFAAYIPKDLQLNIFDQPTIILFLSILVLIVSVLAGLYPSVLLSSYKPVLVLKGSVSGKDSSKTWLRKGLTVSQFVIAQVFIIATLLVSKQINYSLNKNIGIKKDAVLYFGNYTDTSSAKKNLLVNKLKAIPGVASVSLSMDPPSSTSTWTDNMKYEDDKKEIQTDVQVKIGDSNYIKLYQIKLLAGSNLVINDSMGDLLINETYLHALGFTNPNDVIDHYIDVYGKKRVAGVVQDFNQKSLHESITPLLITGDIHSEYTFNIALQPQNQDGTAWQTTIGKMQEAWKEIYPDKDFEYTFLDDDIAGYYAAEKNISTLLMWSTGLTIFISCLGLLGFVIYTTNMRTKEIGIRKVIGATVSQIVILLSKDFVKLIAVAFVIAIPIAWYAANAWLQNFAYRTTLDWWIFLAGGLLLFFIALTILCMRTIKAAVANPIKSLKTE